MKHTIEELHFAAKVRDLALHIKGCDWSEAVDQWGESKSMDEKTAGIDAFRANWQASHSLPQYLKQAYQLIHDAADIISEIRHDAR